MADEKTDICSGRGCKHCACGKRGSTLEKDLRNGGERERQQVFFTEIIDKMLPGFEYKMPDSNPNG